VTIRVERGLTTAAALLWVSLWSSGFVATKVCVRYCPPMTLLSVRFLLASAVMWGIVKWSGAKAPASRAAWFRLGIFAVLNLALPMAFNFVALQRVSAGIAAIVAATNPLLLAMLAPKLLGERLTSKRVLGLLLGFGGVLFVMIARLGLKERVDTPTGVLLLMAHVVSSVFATLLFKRFPPRESLLVVNAVQLLVSGLLLLVPAALFERLSPTFNGALIFAFLYLLFALSIGAALIWFWLLSRGEASVASSYLFLCPLLGLLFAAIFLGEKLSVRDGVGLVVTMIGIVLIRARAERP
jgi:drug/metabolite transporter (DMT)-like permease